MLCAPFGRRTTINRLRHLCRGLVFLCLLPAGQVAAGPWVDAGNESLRSDIQILADAGIITASATIWPMSWADVMDGIDAGGGLLTWEAAALRRVRAAAAEAAGDSTLRYTGSASVSGNPVEIRGFTDTPRETGEVTAGMEYSSGRYATRLQATWANNPDDGKRIRADGSYATVALGNWLISASTQDRWFGPGWQSSLILGNNARPVPSISFDRNLSTPFENRWLSWIGHWDFSMQVGQLESDRAVPNGVLWTARVTARPIRKLEIGLTRAAQLCGDGRSCDLSTWARMFLGKDNKVTNVTRDDEPGNQLGGWDIRWSSKFGSVPYAWYTQWIGEDEGGGAPTKYTALFGVESWSWHNRLGTYRMYLEWADTMCNFALYKGSNKVRPDCAYNNSIFESGYRYRSRSLGSSFDNDASVWSYGMMVTQDNSNSWQLNLRYGNLNRKDADDGPDLNNSVATNKTRYREFLLTHRRNTGFGKLHLGAGYDYRKDTLTRITDDDFRVFLDWSMPTR